MEKWLDTFSGKIPKDTYFMNIKSGEEDGLLIELEGSENRKEKVIIDFYTTKALRVVEEGLYLADEVFLDGEIEKYKETGFQSTMYEIENGDFGNFIKKTSSGVYEFLEMKHYIIITLNFVIEVISSVKPEIKIEKVQN